MNRAPGPVLELDTSLPGSSRALTPAPARTDNASVTLARFHLLHRRFKKLANADLSTLDPSVVQKLISDADAYFASPREPELDPAHTDSYVRSAVRNTALRILESSEGHPCREELAAFIERLPAEEVLPNGARFSSDFVAPHALSWYRALEGFVGKPDLNGLEVGSFEGRSCIWFLSNVLTHPSCRMTCIDTFDFGGQGRDDIDHHDLQDRFDRNIAAAGFAGRVTKVFGSSQEQLRALPLGRYDLAYIDGSHLTSDVLEDVVLAWRLLRRGAVLILDDYAYHRNHENDAKIRPDVAIDAFMTCFVGAWTELHRGYQIILRKDVA